MSFNDTLVSVKKTKNGFRLKAKPFANGRQYYLFHFVMASAPKGHRMDAMILQSTHLVDVGGSLENPLIELKNIQDLAILDAISPFPLIRGNEPKPTHGVYGILIDD